MQYQYIGYRVKGFYKLADLALRVSQMSESAQKRYEILVFWERHGLAATVDAFNISRRTLYHWKKKLKEASGDIAGLAAKSTAPIGKRKRLWPEAVHGEIRRLRQAHVNLAKEKIYPLLREFCQKRQLPCPSMRTIGRLIHDAPDKMRRVAVRVRPNGKQKPMKRDKKQRKPKGFSAQYPGHCVALDSIERFHNGIRRYIISFKDCYSRFGFAVATSSHKSYSTRAFLKLVQAVFPYKIEHVLTDNGLRFESSIFS